MDKPLYYDNNKASLDDTEDEVIYNLVEDITCLKEQSAQDQALIDKMVKALEFYSNEGNYYPEPDSIPTEPEESLIKSKIESDEGSVAQRALNEVKEVRE